MDYLYALQSLREAAPGFINYVFLFVSEIMVKILPVFAGIIYWSVNKREGAAILLGYFSADSVNQLIKNTACIYRPWILDKRLYVDAAAKNGATGYSFPSGHTTTAASFFGGFALFLKKTWATIVFSLLILLVAFSRNWLGAHTFFDVAIAILHTGFALFLTRLIAHFLEKRPWFDTLVAVLGIAISAAVLIYLSLKHYPLDYAEDGSLLADPYKMLTDCYTAAGLMIGGLLGWWLERHFIGFEVRVKKSVKILRTLVGSLSFLILFLFLGKIFAFIGEHWQHFAKYFTIAFWSLFVYPLLFSLVERSRKPSEK